MLCHSPRALIPQDESHCRRVVEELLRTAKVSRSVLTSISKKLTCQFQIARNTLKLDNTCTCKALLTLQYGLISTPYIRRPAPKYFCHISIVPPLCKLTLIIARLQKRTANVHCSLSSSPQSPLQQKMERLRTSHLDANFQKRDIGSPEPLEISMVHVKIRVPVD